MVIDLREREIDAIEAVCVSFNGALPEKVGNTPDYLIALMRNTLTGMAVALPDPIANFEDHFVALLEAIADNTCVCNS